MIVVPEPLVNIIVSEARKRNMTPEDFLSEIILNTLNLDPEDKIEIYVKLHKKYVKDAEELIAKGEFTQASEKIWGAAALIVKAAALKIRGVRLSSHGELWEFVSELATKKGDDELRRLWRTAISMHINFYENWAPPEDVKKALEDIKLFAKKIAQYTNLKI